MITILTHSPYIFSKENIKARLRKILKKQRGPSAVVQSLHRGLTEVNIEHQIDPPVQNVSGIVHVVSGVGALRYAIKLKKKGKIKKLIAGPNIVIRSQDKNNIIADENIDVILLPSQWNADFFISQCPILSSKIRIWPAGVSIPKMPEHVTKDTCLIYRKNVPEKLYANIIGTLKKAGVQTETIAYGNFRQEDYYRLLEKSSHMIYLQKVESQGIALQEAWARNVPTLVWNPGSFTYPTGETVAGNISAPYLTDKAGMFFADANGFERIYPVFIKRLSGFKPRDYSIEKLSDKALAKIYSAIIDSL